MGAFRRIRRTFIAPGANVRLISIQQLDLAGCTGDVGNGIMNIYNKDGQLILKEEY